MTEPMTVGTILRRAAFAVAYLAVCVGGMVGAVEIGTEIGAGAADATALHGIDAPAGVVAYAGEIEPAGQPAR